MEEIFVLKELVIEDVEPNESDDDLWSWVVEAVLNKNGIPIFPWTRRSLVRSGTRAIVTLDLRIDPNREPQKAN